MRKIGTAQNREELDTFIKILSAYNIECKEEDPEASPEESLDIWVLADEAREAATVLLERFRKNPQDEFFKKKAQEAALEAEAKILEFKRSRHREIDARTQIFARQSGSKAPVTMTLFVLSIAYFCANLFDRNHVLFQTFAISVDRLGLFFGQYFPEVRQGQVWRLITPIFIHSTFCIAVAR